MFIPSALANNTVIPPAGESGPCDFVAGNMGWDCIPFYIQYLANLVVGFTIAIALLMLIINGYRFALGALGGEGASESAKKGIIYALVGVAIALLAYIIVDTVFIALTSS